MQSREVEELSLLQRMPLFLFILAQQQCRPTEEAGLTLFYETWCTAS